MSAPKTANNIDGFFRARTAAPVRPAVEKVTVAVSAAKPTSQVALRAARAANHAKAHKPQASQRVHAATKPSTKVPVSHTAAEHRQINVNHAKAHKPQAAVTLMRTAVKRPSPSLKAQTKVQSSLTHSTPSLIPVKHTAQHIDEDRLVRASSVGVSPLIAHHGKQVQKVAIGVVPLAVQPMPTNPVKPGDDTPAGAPAPLPNNNPQPQDIFNHALANAANFLDVREHRSHFRKQAKRHITSMAAGTLALLVIAGFAAYQNTPGLQLKVAGVQAGVATHMPNFSAAGFAYNGVKAGEGKLTLGFSNANGNYQLVQQNTSWSGTDMIQDVSAVDASGNPNYTTVQAGITTVYRFSNSNAMWVSNGKWYTVTGTGALSNNQVKSLVQNV